MQLRRKIAIVLILAVLMSENVTVFATELSDTVGELLSENEMMDVSDNYVVRNNESVDTISENATVSDDDNSVIQVEKVNTDTEESIGAGGDVVASGTCGDNLTWKLTGAGDYKTLSISGTGAMYDYHQYLEGGSFTDDAPWSQYDEYITDIVLNEGITRIGDYAFHRCGNWMYSYVNSSVEIPEGVTEIGDNAFSHSYYTEYKLPNSLKIIGGWAFEFTPITHITLPKGLESIGGGAFGYTELRNVDLPDNVILGISGDGEVFRGCEELKSIYFGKNAHYANIYQEQSNNAGWRLDEVLQGCSKLEKIEVHPDNPYLCAEEGVLYTKDKKVLLRYPQGKLNASFYTPSGVEIINRGSFENCPYTNANKLESVILTKGVKRIDAYAFSGTTSISCVYIPKTVTTIGPYIFNENSNGAYECPLRDVYYEGNESEWNKLIAYTKNENPLLLNAMLHFNSEIPEGEEIPNIEPQEYSFDEIIDINGRGNAFVKIYLFDADGNILRNSSVMYSNDGSELCSIFGMTDENGVLELATESFENMGNKPYTKDITFKIEPITEGTSLYQDTINIKISVNPLSYEEKYRQEFSANIDAKSGIGAGVTIGPVEAGAYAGVKAGVDDGSMLEASLEVDGVKGTKKLVLSDGYKTEAHGGGEVKAGVILGNKSKKEIEKRINEGKYDITAIDYSLEGNVATESTKSIVISDINNITSTERKEIIRLIKEHIMQQPTTSAFMYEALINDYVSLGNSYSRKKFGLGANVSSDFEVGKIDLDKYGSVNVYGIGFNGGVESSHSVNEDEQKEIVTSKTVIEANQDLLDYKAKFKGDMFEWSEAVYSNGVKNRAELSVEKVTGNDSETSLKVKTANTYDEGYVFFDKSHTQYEEFIVKGSEAQTLINKNEQLKLMNNMKLCFPKSGTYDDIIRNMVKPETDSVHKKKTECKEGIDFPVNLSMAIGVGGEVGCDFSGEHSLEYDVLKEQKIFNEDTNIGAYGASLQIGNIVESQESAIVQILKAITGSIFTDIGNAVTKIVSDTVNSATNAYFTVIDFGKEIGKRTISIFSVNSDDSNAGGLNLMTYASVEDAAHDKNGSLVTTIGAPYFMSVSENGKEIKELNGNPVTIKIIWTNDMLSAVNASYDDSKSIHIYRFDPDLCTYILVEGETDVKSKCVTAEVNQTGEFVLAIDKNPPNVRKIIIEKNTYTPKIQVYLEDETGIASASLSIDDIEYINKSESKKYIKKGKIEFRIPSEKPLSAGKHIMYISASDTTGNEMEHPASFEFVIDEIEDDEIPNNAPEGVWLRGLKSSYPYTGSAIKPVFKVYHGKTLLKSGKDYTLTYKQNKNPGTAIISIKMKGNYKGSYDKTFKIDKVSLSENVIADTVYVAYKPGKVQKVKPALYLNDKKLGAGSFNYHYPSTSRNGVPYCDIGSYVVRITPKNSTIFTGKKLVDLIIVDKPLMNSVKITANKSSLPYTGNPVEPSFTLSLKGTPLREGSDYTVSFNDAHTDIGKHMVTFTGNNKDYFGKKTYTFSITGKYDLAGSKAAVELDSGTLDPEGNAVYTYGGAKPGVKVTYDGKTLTAGRDYSVSYKNHKTVAKSSDSLPPTVTVKGKGSYKGQVDRTFNIVQRDINTLSLNIADKGYSEKPENYLKTSFLFTDENYKNQGMRKDRDYTVTVSGNYDPAPEPGTVIYVTLTGQGNYKGSIDSSYRIIDRQYDFTKASVRVNNGKAFDYTGKAIKPSVSQLSVTIGKDKTPLSNDDYEIVGYYNNINKGTAYVRLRGKNNYAGVKLVKFRIGAANITDLWSGVVMRFRNAFAF